MTGGVEEIHEPGRSRTRVRTSLWCSGALLGLFLAGALPLILTGWRGGRAYFDQYHFHEPVIRTFAAAWPHVDLTDYKSATAPGYHLVLAAWERYINAGLSEDASRMRLQLVGMVFTAVLLALLGWMAGGRAARAGNRWSLSVIAVLPVLASLYVFPPGVWLIPDNAGWLGVLAILSITLRPQFRWIDAVLAGAILAALVFVRQSHLWCAGVIWAWAWLASGPLDRWTVSQVFARPQERSISLAWGIAVTLPAFAIMAWLHSLWGGLTPKQFQTQHAGGNGATPALVLSLVALYSAFFGAWLMPALARIWQEQRWLVVAAGCAGAALAFVSPTTYFYETRGSGFWNLVKVTDGWGLAIFVRPIQHIPSGPGIRGTPNAVLMINGAMAEGTSLLVALLSCAGGACLVAWLWLLRARERAVIALALAGFTVAQSMNANAWQRYIEPLVLMVLGLIAAGSSIGGMGAGGERWARTWRMLRVAGPLVLTLVLGAVTAKKISEDPLLWGLPGGAKPPAAPAP